MSRPSFRFTAALFTLTALLAAFTFGCAHSPVTNKSTTSQSPSARRAAAGSRKAALAAVVSVQQMPEYRRAEALASRRDWYGAVHVLERIRGSHPLRDDEQAFVDRQIAICRDEMKPRATVKPQRPVQARAPSRGDCGPRCLQAAFVQLGIKADLATISKRSNLRAEGVSLANLSDTAQSYGLAADALQVSEEQLASIVTPALGWEGGRDHFILIRSIHRSAGIGSPQVARVWDPDGREADATLDEVMRATAGIVLCLRKGNAAAANTRR